MVTVTDSARRRLMALMAEEGYDPAQTYVRVGVRGGGCSGLAYDLSFDRSCTDSDKIFEDNGIRIAVDKKSLLYLVGTQLDFSDGLNGKGFSFLNPNAARTCGCGESFSV